MNSEFTPTEKARHLADLHRRNIICAGEAWGQLIEFVTQENVASCLSVLPDDLQYYCAHLSLETSNEEVTEGQRRGIGAIKIWHLGRASL